MSNKEKLDLLVKDWKLKNSNLSQLEDAKKKWHDYALRGSVQSRKAKSLLLR